MARPRVPNAVFRAFDEAQFGASRTLNLRDRLPTGPEAAARAEAWLRLKQVEGAREVLVITGRGANSAGGLPVLRPQVSKRLASLKRAGVVESISEHTPGSFVVRLAPVSAMLTASERGSDRARGRGRANALPSLAGLMPETQRILWDLAGRIFESLGIHAPTRAMLADEVHRQIDLLTAAMPPDAERESWIRSAALRVLSETD